jgi:CrcB protein
MNLFAVAVGGFAGAIARSSLALFIVNYTETVIPVATLTVNLLGSFGLAFFLTLAGKGLNLPLPVKVSITTGFFGSFTTFSTISLESVHLLDYYGAFWWLTYEFFNISGGLLAVFLGYLAANKLFHAWNKQKVKVD